ncbi:MAG: hypothetical protein NTY83_03695 [Candidatus Micrarchaeota archaeon]|nr:hypothetical protein [Candidatus Micrarchaeota archaeon]
MAEEKKKVDAPCCGGDSNMLYLWAVGGLLLGLIVGFFISGMVPATNTGTGTGGNTTAATVFTLDQAKVSQIGGFLANYYYVSTGEETAATFTRYVDKGDYVELYYTVAGQEMPIMVSKDYKYFYAGAYELAPTIAQMETARQDASLQTQAEAEGIPQSSNPQVQMFVMSYCPYGNQAEGGLVPVIQLLGDSATFEPVYIIYVNASRSGYECTTNEGTEYCSMHGNSELWQDVREKIVFSMYGEKKWAEYVGRANSECTVNNIDTCWATVADETGVNKTAVTAEFEASKFDIIKAEVTKTGQNGVSGSPTIKINGVTFNGGRTAQAYKDAICGAYTTAPEECGQNVSSTATAASGSCG